MVESFRLLDYLDEELGHQIWYTSLYLLFLLYFSSCFYTQPSRIRGSETSDKHYPTFSLVAFSVLLALSVLHEWYAVTEAQVFTHFVAASLVMITILASKHGHGKKLDANGLFLLLRMGFTVVLVGLWVAVTWRDGALRDKYRENWLFVPEPWSYASLHLMKPTINNTD